MKRKIKSKAIPNFEKAFYLFAIAGLLICAVFIVHGRLAYQYHEMQPKAELLTKLGCLKTTYTIDEARAMQRILADTTGKYPIYCNT